MKLDLRWLFAAAATTIIAVLVVLAQPALLGVAVLGVGAVISLRWAGDWWRRTFILTILAMFAGASHLSMLAIPGSLAKMGMLGMLLLVTVVTTAKNRPTYRGSLHKYFLGVLWGIVALALVSVLWSEARLSTAIQAITFTAFALILHRVSTARWADGGTMRADLAAAYWASTVALAIGAAMAAAGVSGAVSTFDGRHLGLLNNPNLLGMIAAITVALGVGVAAHRRSPLIWASLAIPASQVLLSQSRTAMLAVALGLTWAVLRGGLVRILAVGVLAGIGVIVAALFRFNPFEGSLERFGSLEGGDVLNQRTTAWADVFWYISDNPLGIGWASTTDALASLNAAGITSGLSSIHNSYLQLMFELGWAGMIPVLLLLIGFVVVAFRADANKSGAGLVAVVVTGMVIQFTESAIFGIGQPYPYLFWLAVLAAIVNTEPKPGPEPKARQRVKARPGNFPALVE